MGERHPGRVRRWGPARRTRVHGKGARRCLKRAGGAVAQSARAAACLRAPCLRALVSGEQGVPGWCGRVARRGPGPAGALLPSAGSGLSRAGGRASSPRGPAGAGRPGLAAGGRKEVVDAEPLPRSPSWCRRERRAGHGPAEPQVRPRTATAFLLPSLVLRGTGTGQGWPGRQRPRPSGAGPEWRGWPEPTAPPGSPCRGAAGAALAPCPGLQPRVLLAAGLWQRCSAVGARGAAALPGGSVPTAPAPVRGGVQGGRVGPRSAQLRVEEAEVCTSR